MTRQPLRALIEHRGDFFYEVPSPSSLDSIVPEPPIVGTAVRSGWDDIWRWVRGGHRGAVDLALRRAYALCARCHARQGHLDRLAELRDSGSFPGSIACEACGSGEAHVFCYSHAISAETEPLKRVLGAARDAASTTRPDERCGGCGAGLAEGERHSLGLSVFCTTCAEERLHEAREHDAVAFFEWAKDARGPGGGFSHWRPSRLEQRPELRSAWDRTDAVFADRASSGRSGSPAPPEDDEDDAARGEAARRSKPRRDPLDAAMLGACLGSLATWVVFGTWLLGLLISGLLFAAVAEWRLGRTSAPDATPRAVAFRALRATGWAGVDLISVVAILAILSAMAGAWVYFFDEQLPAAEHAVRSGSGGATSIRPIAAEGSGDVLAVVDGEIVAVRGGAASATDSVSDAVLLDRGLLLAVHGGALAQREGGVLVDQVSLPAAGLRISGGRHADELLFYGAADETVYRLDRSGAIDSLFSADRPVVSLTASAREILFSTGPVVYGWGDDGTMRLVVAFPEGRVVSSLAYDRRGEALYLTAEHDLYRMDDQAGIQRLGHDLAGAVAVGAGKLWVSRPDRASIASIPINHSVRFTWMNTLQAAGRLADRVRDGLFRVLSS